MKQREVWLKLLIKECRPKIWPMHDKISSLELKWTYLDVKHRRAFLSTVISIEVKMATMTE